MTWTFITRRSLNHGRTISEDLTDMCLRLIESDIKVFREYCAKNNKQRDGMKRQMEYHLGMNYEVFFATTEVKSIKLT
jgi:hypothetical protein